MIVDLFGRLLLLLLFCDGQDWHGFGAAGCRTNMTQIMPLRI